MREDFGKVVIERPRVGSGNQNRPTRETLPKGLFHKATEEEIEDGGSRRKMSMGEDRAYRKHGGKEFSDLLGPLHRLLHTRVGRSVNSVRSELSKVIGGKSEPQRHVLTVHFENLFRVTLYKYSYWAGGFYQDEQGRVAYQKPKRYRIEPKDVAERAARRAEMEAKRHKPESCPKCAQALKEHNAQRKVERLSE